MVHNPDDILVELRHYLDKLVNAKVPFKWWHPGDNVGATGPFYYSYLSAKEVPLERLVSQGINSIGLLNIIARKFMIKLPKTGGKTSDWLSYLIDEDNDGPFCVNMNNCYPLEHC